jgi:chromate transport protein ChrA
MVNPYYYLFYLFYRVLKPLSKDEDRIPFAIIAFMAIVFIIHAVIMLVVFKSYYDLTALPRMNKLLFGVVSAILYFLVNNILFEKNNRYVYLMKRIKEASFYKKVTALFVLMSYFLSPLLILFINR